jgi:hypothetical protein
MMRGTPMGMRTLGPLTCTSVSDAEECAPVDEVDEEPYSGTTKAAPSNAALYANAATVHQNA